MKLFSSKNIAMGLLCTLSFTLGGFITKNNGDDKITASIIQQAEKIIGIDFTDTEADSMLNEVDDQLEYFQELRKLTLSNSVSPALVFHPLPAGYQFPDQKSQFIASSGAPVGLPANREELAFYTIRQLAGLLKSKNITSVELTRFYLTRLKKYNSRLLNVITFTDELAMKQAAKADAEISSGKYRGLLHGIPYGVKDMLSVKGYKTTFGSAAYKNQVFDENAT